MVVHIYIFVLWKFFLEITECQWIINAKAFFMLGIWKKVQLNVGIASQFVQKFPGELKPQGKLIC